MIIYYVSLLSARHQHSNSAFLLDVLFLNKCSEKCYTFYKINLTSSLTISGSGGKAIRKGTSSNNSITVSRASSSADKVSSGSGGNSVHPRETPSWQKPITTFFAPGPKPEIVKIDKGDDQSPSVPPSLKGAESFEINVEVDVHAEDKAQEEMMDEESEEVKGESKREKEQPEKPGKRVKYDVFCAEAENLESLR